MKIPRFNSTIRCAVTAFAATALPWPAAAQACPPCDPPGSAARAAATVSARLGAGISLMSSQVQGSIKSGAMGGVLAQTLTAEGDRQTLDALLQGFDNMIRQSTMASIFVDASRDFDVIEEEMTTSGGTSIQRTSIPLTTCKQQTAARGAQVSREYSTVKRAENMAKRKEYNAAPRSRRAGSSGGIRRRPATGWKPEELMVPKEDTKLSLGKMEAEEARDTVLTLTNPNPIPVLEGPAAATEQGKLYEDLREMYNARIAIGQAVLLDRTATMSAPDEPTATQRSQAQIVRRLWQKVNPRYNPLSPEGAVSEAEWLNTRANMPYFDSSMDPDRSERWLDELKGMNEKALLIESLTQQAVQMRVQYRTMVAIEQIASMMAVDFTARQGDQANSELGALRGQVSKSNLNVSP